MTTSSKTNMNEDLKEKIRDIIHFDLMGNDDNEKRIADEIVSLLETAISKEYKGGYKKGLEDVRRFGIYRVVGENEYAIIELPYKIYQELLTQDK